MFKFVNILIIVIGLMIAPVMQKVCLADGVVAGTVAGATAVAGGALGAGAATAGSGGTVGITAATVAGVAAASAAALVAGAISGDDSGIGVLGIATTHETPASDQPQDGGADTTVTHEIGKYEPVFTPTHITPSTHNTVSHHTPNTHSTVSHHSTTSHH